MTSKSQGGRIKRRAATRADIEAAIDQLTPADTTRINRFAEAIFRAYGGRNPRAETTKDFIQEAFLKLLSGERKWYPAEKAFVFHIMNIVGSLISHWSESPEVRFRSDERLLVLPGGEEAHRGWIDDVESSLPGPEVQTMWKQQYAKMMNKLIDQLRSTPKAVEVLMLKRIGLSSAEIMAQLSLTQNQFENLDKQIRRKATIIQLQEELSDRPSRPGSGRVMSFMWAAPASGTLSLDELLALASTFQPDEGIHERMVGMFKTQLATAVRPRRQK